MKRLSIFLFVIFLVLGVSTVTKATTLSPWSDVAKTWTDDTLLCWAAAASNMLWYSGWDANYSNVGAIFDEFKSAWTDGTGNAFQGIDWWFDGSSAMPGTATLANASLGNHYGFDPYTAGSQPLNWGDTEWKMMNYISGDVTNNYVFSILIMNGTSAQNHFVTGWGYDGFTFNGWDAPAPANGTTATIHITDSDQNLDTLSPITVTYNAANLRWDLDYTYGQFGGVSGYWIDSIYRLAKNTDDMDPIPEPSTFLLLGSGLIAVVVWRGKK